MSSVLRTQTDIWGSNQIMAENSPPKPLPNWLNGDFLEKQLQNYHLDESVKLMRFDVKPAMAKGDGYLSAMFRVTVYYTDAQLPIDNVCFYQQQEKIIVFFSFVWFLLWSSMFIISQLLWVKATEKP